MYFFGFQSFASDLYEWEMSKLVLLLGSGLLFHAAWVWLTDLGVLEAQFLARWGLSCLLIYATYYCSRVLISLKSQLNFFVFLPLFCSNGSELHMMHFVHVSFLLFELNEKKLITTLIGCMYACLDEVSSVWIVMVWEEYLCMWVYIPYTLSQSHGTRGISLHVSL